MSTSKSGNQVYLICQAHIDPMWIWDFEEGLTETLATFEAAANLLDEYPEFVFNHNESMLYEWTKAYRPELFERIRSHVQNGRWAVAGGWFLQPDCNLPCGESIARQILLGRQFFREEFGIEPKVAYNLDTFGHNGNLPQFLRQAGYEAYVHFRPTPGEKAIGDFIYRWRGVDGAEIPALRPPCGWYCTHPQDPIEAKIERMRALAVERNRPLTAFWGAGNHGGGATRADLEKIRAARDGQPPLVHARLEDYCRDVVIPVSADQPVVEGELQKCFTGCYTSIIEIKQRNRRGEGLLLAAERYAALAWWLLGEAYPGADLDAAWKDVLLNQFHDILPGSCIREAARSSAEIMGRSATNAREIALRAQLALLKSVDPKEPLTVRLLNPQASARRVPALVDVQVATHPAQVHGKRLALFDAEGRPVARQLLAYKSNTADWRTAFLFEADLPALGLAEYRIAFEEASPAMVKRDKPNVADLPISAVQQMPYEDSCTAADHSSWFAANASTVTVDAQDYTAVLCSKTGRLLSLRHRETGIEFLAHPSGRLVVRADNSNAWGGEAHAYGPCVGVFDPPSPNDLADITAHYGEEDPAPAVRICAAGPLALTVEVILTYKQSVARLRYTFYRHFPHIDAEVLVNWTERRRALQFEFRTAVHGPEYSVEIPHAAIVRRRGNGEEPCGRWTMVHNDASAFALVNDGPGGVEVQGPRLLQTLLRSAVFTGGHMTPAPGYMQEFMSLGEHIFRFKLAFGAHAKVRAVLPALVEDLVMPIAYHCSLPLNAAGVQGLRNGEDVIRIDTDGVVRLEALKQSQDGQSLVVRLVERGGAGANATLVLAGENVLTAAFRPYEMKTFRLDRTAGRTASQECDLLERPLGTP